MRGGETRVKERNERMKIAIVGYGKMGHMVEEMARKRGHEIVCIIDQDTPKEVWDSAELRSADVAIEFTTPLTAEDNVRKALQRGLKVVSGTTGWTIPQDLQQAMDKGQLVWKSNFSIGVNILFELNKDLAARLAPYAGYQPHITEIHHVHKLDKPSGTAKTLKEGIEQANAQGQVAIESIREGEVPGTHTVVWDSEEDTIVIQHIAKGRQGFALGAVVAAEELVNG